LSLFFPDGLPVVLGFPPFPFPIPNITSKNIKELLEICSEIKPEKFSLVTKSTHIHVFFKYILCLIIILFQHNPVKEDQCYVCKRTEAEVREFLLPTLGDADARYNAETAEIESKLQKMEDDVRSYLDDILKATEKSNLDFKIEAVVVDIDSFKKIIPRVEDLISNADTDDPHWFTPKRGLTLLDVRNKLLKIRKDIEGKKIYQTKVEKNMGIRYDEIIERNRIELSECWTWEVFTRYHGPYSDFLESLGDTMHKLEMNVGEKSSRNPLLKYQKKVIEMTKHRKITRQIKSVTTYPQWEIWEDRVGGHSLMPDDAVGTTDFSFNVCAVCYTLVWHDGPSISSSFHDETKPVLKEGEKIISMEKRYQRDNTDY
jgi:hypothetical protein